MRMVKKVSKVKPRKSVSNPKTKTKSKSTSNPKTKSRHTPDDLVMRAVIDILQCHRARKHHEYGPARANLQRAVGYLDQYASTLK